MSADLLSTIPDQAAIRRFLDRPAVAEVLGLMCFECGPPAQIFRLAGHKISRRAEDEQAFIMRRALERVITHGAGWRGALGDDMNAILAKHKDAQAAKVAGTDPADASRPFVGDAAS